MDAKMLDLVNKLATCQAKCNHCFNSCLKEKDIEMMKGCIKLDKDCSEICGIALSYLTSESSFTKEILQLCAAICQRCAHECGQHNNEHCKECTKACNECVEACNAYIR